MAAERETRSRSGRRSFPALEVFKRGEEAEPGRGWAGWGGEMRLATSSPWGGAGTVSGGFFRREARGREEGLGVGVVFLPRARRLLGCSNL